MAFLVMTLAFFYNDYIDQPKLTTKKTAENMLNLHTKEGLNLKRGFFVSGSTGTLRNLQIKTDKFQK